mmetsp:Transcript_6327/g.12861  ORF Transcript_6327/g.12861 Transcript_6327/m.12861 type:complete len:504 (+) Transcript_6327:279-1790(+)
MLAEEQDVRCALYSLSTVVARRDGLLRQLEYYFGDENLPKDHFLLHKQLRGNPRNWCTIKVLLTFPKLKRQGIKAREVVRAVKHASQNANSNNKNADKPLLEVSKDGRAIRRTRAMAIESGALGGTQDDNHDAEKHVEEEDLEKIARTVRVTSLASMQDLRDRSPISETKVRAYFEEQIKKLPKIFGGAGEQQSAAAVKDMVKSVRLENMQQPNQKEAFARKPQPYALVELASQQLAAAMVEAHASTDWRRGVQVKRERPTKKHNKHNNANIAHEADQTPQQQQQQQQIKKQNKKQQNKSKTNEDAQACSTTPQEETVSPAAPAPVAVEPEAMVDAAEEDQVDTASAQANRRKGKVRTLDRDNLEGFIADFPSKIKMQRKKGPRSYFFRLADKPEEFRKLRVGSVVSYIADANGNAMHVELDQEAEEKHRVETFEAEAAEAGTSMPTPPRRKPKPKAGTAASSFVSGAQGSFARGPPNEQSKYRGFGHREWRGLRGVAQTASA